LRVVDDSAGKERILKTLIDAHDPAYRAQWDVELTGEFRERMKSAIVGCEIAVERLEGKFKLSQNRPAPDQSAVRAAHARGDAQARLLSEWMQRLGIGAAG
jgi:transcriptional regulator